MDDKLKEALDSLRIAKEEIFKLQQLRKQAEDNVQNALKDVKETEKYYYIIFIIYTNMLIILLMILLLYTLMI